MKKWNALCSSCGERFETEREEFDFYIKCPNGHINGYLETTDNHQYATGETIDKVFEGEYETLLLMKSGKIVRVVPDVFDGASIKKFEKKEF